MASIVGWLKEYWLFLIAGTFAVLVFIGLLAYGIAEQGKWEAWCKDQGGHIISDTDTVVSTGVDSDGNSTVNVGSQTDYYCLNAGGGIIDIR